MDVYLQYKISEEKLQNLKSVSKLIFYLSSSHSKMYLPKEFKKEFENYPKTLFKKKNFVKRMCRQVYRFFYNIPSDYYRVLYPEKFQQ